MVLYQTHPFPLAPSDRSHEVDVELITFVERYATNLARWDLLLYFGLNPSLSDSVDGIARGIGRFPQTIQKELEDLAFLGVLRSRANDKGRVYELTRVSHVRKAVLRLAGHFRRPADSN